MQISNWINMKANRLIANVLGFIYAFVLFYLVLLQRSEETIQELDTAYFGSACEIANNTFRAYTPVDLRIIVITYNRPKSLLRLLRSLNNVRYEGDAVVVDIWVDRSKDESVNSETITKVLQFHFNAGVCHLHIRDHHGGLRKQWLEVTLAHLKKHHFFCFPVTRVIKKD